MAKRGFSDYDKGATSIGTFVWPKLDKPDLRFEPEYGTFSVDLDLRGKPAEDFIARIEAAYEQEYAAECKTHDLGSKAGEDPKQYVGRPYGEATEGKEKEVIPGATRFKFKTTAGGKYSPKHPKKPGEVWRKKSVPVLGAAGDILVTEEVWGGTQGRVSFVLVPWFMPVHGFGVRLELKGVKVLELVSKGQVTAKGLGFEDEEGYEPPVDDIGHADKETDSDGDSEVGEGTGGVEF